MFVLSVLLNGRVSEILHRRALNVLKQSGMKEAWTSLSHPKAVGDAHKQDNSAHAYRAGIHYLFFVHVHSQTPTFSNAE